MLKRSAIAVVLVFLVWSGMDMVIHGMLLGPIYEATASLWRPMEQMNMPLMYFVSVVSAIGFVAIYALLVNQKSLAAGVKLGLLFGLVAGICPGDAGTGLVPSDGFVAGGLDTGGLFPGGFSPGGLLTGGLFPGGLCPGGLCPGGGGRWCGGL